MISIRKGTVIAGKYRLEEPLARGGMGSIWVARHIQLDVLVAVKFIDPDFASTSEGRGRFEREAKSAAMLHSPHVVQIHDYGVEFETPYIAMELLQGEDLSTRLKREGRLALEAAAKIAIHVSKALRRAHEAGIVHRDLKPSNIFIVHGDEDDELIKVLDFGVAKDLSLGSASADETRRGALIGSPRYMSPEQARRNREIDHRSDLWSLGVILFRAVTGQLPFPGDEIGDVIVKICSDPLPIPSEIAPDLGPEVDRFFLKALAREPSQRFQSAREMASEFAILAGALPPASRFTWPLPGDGMRISWLPGIPSDYAQSISGASLVMPPTSSPTPSSGASSARPDPTPVPAGPASPTSLLIGPVSPVSLVSPVSRTSPSAADQPAPLSPTMPVRRPVTVPPSTPTLLERTKLTERAKLNEKARLEQASKGSGPPSSSSDLTRIMPGHDFDDLEQAAMEAGPSAPEGNLDPISSKGRLTPPTRLDPPVEVTRPSAPVVAEAMRKSSPSVEKLEKAARASSPSVDKVARASSPSVDKVARASSPSVDKVDRGARKSSPSVDKVARGSSPSVDKVARKSSPSVDRVAGKSSPGTNPSATLTSSTGTVDIPSVRPPARSRRPVALWVAVASALVIVSGAMAVVRLTVGQGDPAPASSERDAPTTAAVETRAPPAATPAMSASTRPAGATTASAASAASAAGVASVVPVASAMSAPRVRLDGGVPVLRPR